MLGKKLFDFMDSRESPLAKDFLGNLPVGLVEILSMSLPEKMGLIFTLVSLHPK